MGAIARFFAPFRRNQQVTLLHDRGTGTPQQEEMAREAAADVERVEEDAKYFGENAPANEDELLYHLPRSSPAR